MPARNVSPFCFSSLSCNTITRRFGRKLANWDSQKRKMKRKLFCCAQRSSFRSSRALSPSLQRESKTAPTMIFIKSNKSKKTPERRAEEDEDNTGRGKRLQLLLLFIVFLLSVHAQIPQVWRIIKKIKQRENEMR